MPVTRPALSRLDERLSAAAIDGRVRGRGAVAAEIVATAPGATSLLGEAQSAAPEVTGATKDTSGVDGPVVAHITDAAGDISLYAGEREIAYRDPALVQHLLRAACCPSIVQPPDPTPR